MNQLPEIDQTNAPEGWEYRWEPVGDAGLAGTWRVVTGYEATSYRCRAGTGNGHKSCGAPSVMKLDRSKAPPRSDPARGVRSNWWHYCEQHAYGRIVVDGVIYSKALRPVSDA